MSARRITLQETLDRLAVHRREQHRQAVQRLAASLPRQASPAVHGAPDKHEARSPGRDRASTTHDSGRGVLGGCCLHGRA